MQITESVILGQEICTRRESCRYFQENEKLREIFQFASREFEEKNTKIASLSAELSQAYTRINEIEKEKESLQKRLQEVEAKNNLLNKMLFDKKSERAVDGIIIKHSKKRGARKDHPGHGRKIPENLPKIEKIIEIPENERHCSICGKPIIETGLEEVSYEICSEVIYYIKEIKRKTYKKTCCCDKPIITASVPSKLIPKGKFGISFWVDMLINKYKNHLPVERQIVNMKDYGLNVSAGTIFGGFNKIHSFYIEALYKAMANELRKANNIHADESGWKLFIIINGKDNYKWFIWVFISKDIALFVLDPTRSSKVPYKVLFDIELDEIENIDNTLLKTGAMKILNVDKFSSYKSLKNMGFVELAYCWAHQRREFLELKTKYSELDNWVDEWIKIIAELYHINNERKKYIEEVSIFEKYDKELREKIDGIHSLINIGYNHPAQTAIMNSMKQHWDGLTLFVDHPEIDMDNNLAERILRLMVLGRKNYRGNHARWAGELSVAMFSIVQTCSMHNMSPRAYLTYYLTECAKRGSAPPENEIKSFLPHKLSEDIRRRLKINNPEILAPG